MVDIIVDYVALLLAVILVMIVHEIFKYIVFLIMESKRRTQDFNNLFKVYRYIDLVGLIFFVTTWTGFSRTSKFKITKKRTLVWIGLAGFFSMFFLFCLSAFLSKTVLIESIIPTIESFEYVVFTLLSKTNTMVCYFSLSMMIANLFPMATFDMGYLIAGNSQEVYFNILRFDSVLKLIFTFVVLSGFVNLLVEMLLKALQV